MKKLKIYFLAVLSVFIFSCDDAIDITQPGRFNADAAYQSVEDLRLGLLGVYNELDITDMMEFNSTFTDEISIGFDNGGQGLGDGRYGYILNATSGISSDVWVDHYDAINFATRLIEASALITPTAAEQDEYNNIVGQAYAIRAWSHFMLYSYYTVDYTDDSGLCVIRLDYVPDLDETPGRNTVGEVVGLINNDLDRAENLLNGDNSDPTFMNTDFVTALRARLAAYREDWSSAASFAAELTAKYPLADQDQYFNMYEDTDNTEVIFKLERSVGDSYDAQALTGGGWAGALYSFVSATKDGGPYFEMGRALYNNFADNDIRRERCIDPSSDIDPNYASNPDFRNSDILVIRKYPGSDGQPLLNDLKVFRASEMVLIQAEAAAAQGDLAGAASFLKQIRDARLGEDTPMMTFANEQEAFGAILDERRLELCFEGHRWVDLKRLGQRGNRKIDRDPLDCQINDSCPGSSQYPAFDNANSYKFTLPIPQVESNANPVIREQQNPGY